MQIISCSYERHAAAILAIFNDAILHSTALYDYQARTMENMVSWFKNKELGNYPVIGLENESGELMGFASYGSFRAYPANKYTLEHSVYVAKAYRGQGIAQTLMQHLIALAQEQNYHTLIGSIDASNLGSIALHEKLGFVHAGTIRHAGFKFGDWLDLAFYQLLLPTPRQPIDG
ncbi:GNAT family N-acetyltransferase [Tolumonas lignilytica]|uniref:GNAT family N-acetyltransferase n=1 Tax=Tolumonas lignilytica TaxID=1283284 RepID=UPI000463C3E2|nr:GNAT family N-acetyltransferase [Tolumonas lignilytica]